MITGHINPDTDSVVSAVVLSKFLGMPPAIRGKMTSEAEFVLSYFKVEKPVQARGKKFFLVDHSEPEPGTEVLGIIDHHRMSGLKTDEPIFCLTEPVGSTATIISSLLEKVTKKTAGLLLAGILSDTLNLTSPTTTDDDRKAVRQLVKKSGVDRKKLVQGMFKAKSEIKTKKVEDILSSDFKDFDFNGTKVRISVWETTDLSVFDKWKEKVMKEIAQSKRLHFFALVDILRQNTILYLPPAGQKIAEKAYKGKYVAKRVMSLPGVVSRKKQLVPPLSKIL